MTPPILGTGRYGPVYHLKSRSGRDYAAKMYDVCDCIDATEAFDAEYHAYRTLRDIDLLRGRIPEFYGASKRRYTIYTQVISGPTLKDAVRDPSTTPDLAKTEDMVRETLSIMHNAGVCHGDVSMDNIFSSGILLDFSHARFSSDSEEWPRRKQDDIDMLDAAFHEANKLHKAELALELIESGLDDESRQRQLADLLALARGTERLLSKLKQIRTPGLYLAIAICRKLRRYEQPEEGVALFHEYTPAPDSETDYQLLFTLKLEVAYAQSWTDNAKACLMYADAVKQSSTVLGSSHLETIRLRFGYALCLERARRYAEALEVVYALLSDLKSSEHSAKIPKVKQCRNRVLAKLQRGRGKEEEQSRRKRKGEVLDGCAKRARPIQRENGASDKENDASDKKNDASDKKNDASDKKNDASDMKNDSSDKKNDAVDWKNDASDKKNDALDKKNDSSDKKNDSSDKENDSSDKENDAVDCVPCSNHVM